MKRRSARLHILSSGRKMPLLAAAAVLMLSACSKDPGEPFPPQSPPRPTTDAGGYVTTAQLDLSARPVMPSPGQM